MEKKVEKFWSWFSSIAELLAANYENEELLSEIDNKVLELGDFSWEIGAGKTASNSFTISPNGDPELLNETKSIVSLAPKTKDWEFYYSKQPKDWDFLFELEIDSKIETIDANKWKYVLFKFADGTFDILIESLPLFKLNEDDRVYAVEIALDGVIGEEARINKIGNIEVVSNADKYTSKLSEFTNLNTHLNSLI